MMIRHLLVASVALVAALAAPQPSPVAPDPDGKRPIDAAQEVFIAKMTWMEVRDAMRAGTDTVIIATGGIEQNGPYLVANKHGVVLQAMTESIARELGNALVAPIVDFVPEGDIKPPTVHMKYPSTVSVSEETYRALLTDIVASYKTHGFRHIVLIGDSGGNQDGLKAVAGAQDESGKDGPRVSFIPEYYNYGEVGKFLERHGIKQVPEGLHDDFGITAIMSTVDPTSIRAKQRKKAGKFTINGINLAPLKTTQKWGLAIIRFRTDVTVTAIRLARN
jgi:creatinine amidohydrolase/Fe(II)-dependent formamide hydrolase-like protein